MKVTGQFKGVSINWGSDKHVIAFEINEELTQDMIDEIKDSKLSIEFKKYREKRSLDANALLWACLGEIAAAMQADKWDIYLMMLKRYGKYTYICVKPGVVDAMKAQWRECEVIGEVDINGQTAVQLLCYFGSSTYNTKEFSVLLEGVISEMREMGLPTPTSKEMQLAIESVEKRCGNGKV
jgi:hypothetical protein